MDLSLCLAGKTICAGAGRVISTPSTGGQNALGVPVLNLLNTVPTPSLFAIFIVLSPFF